MVITYTLLLVQIGTRKDTNFDTKRHLAVLAGLTLFKYSDRCVVTKIWETGQSSLSVSPQLNEAHRPYYLQMLPRRSQAYFLVYDTSGFFVSTL